MPAISNNEYYQLIIRTISKSNQTLFIAYLNIEWRTYIHPVWEIVKLNSFCQLKLFIHSKIGLASWSEKFGGKLKASLCSNLFLFTWKSCQLVDVESKMPEEEHKSLNNKVCSADAQLPRDHEGIV